MGKRWSAVVLISLLISTTSGMWKEFEGPTFNIGTCPFSMLTWDYGAVGAPEYSRHCSHVKYYPDNYRKYEQLNPHFLFSRYDNSTIHFIGDSLMLQAFVNFACRLSKYAKLANITRISYHHWCNSKNVCVKTERGPIKSGEITFRYQHKTLHAIFPGQYNQAIPHTFFKNVALNSIVVVNLGKHFELTATDVLYSYMKFQILPQLRQLQDRGVIVFWRETTASKFQTLSRGGSYRGQTVDDDYYTCVNGDELSYPTAWNESTNALIVPLVQSFGIPVLSSFKATFTAPGYCNIGMGVDCTHFFITSGVVNYFTDILLYKLKNFKKVGFKMNPSRSSSA